jgi:hypothetical protein
MILACIAAYLAGAALFARHLIRRDGSPDDLGEGVSLVLASMLWLILWPVLIWLRRRK